jgi:hypothetical protein
VSYHHFYDKNSHIIIFIQYIFYISYIITVFELYFEQNTIEYRTIHYENDRHDQFYNLLYVSINFDSITSSDDGYIHQKLPRNFDIKYWRRSFLPRSQLGRKQTSACCRASSALSNCLSRYSGSFQFSYRIFHTLSKSIAKKLITKSSIKCSNS